MKYIFSLLVVYSVTISACSSSDSENDASTGNS